MAHYAGTAEIEMTAHLQKHPQPRLSTGPESELALQMDEPSRVRPEVEQETTDAATEEDVEMELKEWREVPDPLEADQETIDAAREHAYEMRMKEWREGTVMSSLTLRHALIAIFVLKNAVILPR